MERLTLQEFDKFFDSVEREADKGHSEIVQNQLVGEWSEEFEIIGEANLEAYSKIVMRYAFAVDFAKSDLSGDARTQAEAAFPQMKDKIAKRRSEMRQQVEWAEKDHENEMTADKNFNSLKQLGMDKRINNNYWNWVAAERFETQCKVHGRDELLPPFFEKLKQACLEEKDEAKRAEGIDKVYKDFAQVMAKRGFVIDKNGALLSEEDMKANEMKDWGKNRDESNRTTGAKGLSGMTPEEVREFEKNKDEK